jgi:hypothetical protein
MMRSPGVNNPGRHVGDGPRTAFRGGPMVRGWEGRGDGRYGQHGRYGRGGIIIGAPYYDDYYGSDYYYNDDYEVVSSGDDVARCEARYQSFDRASGTFLGYDGQRHRCPYLP